MTDRRITSEAEWISLLVPLTRGAAGAFGLRDDCAQLRPRAGVDLVLKTDPVRAGVHFFADDKPEDIAWKALAVGVSDLAAKGASPIAYLMAMSFPETPRQDWARRFVGGLSDAQAAFGCHLIGGDTDRAPGPLSVAITIIGEGPTGTIVRRDTAQIGDAIYVSGWLGDSALGLKLRHDKTVGDVWRLDSEQAGTLLVRYLRPMPRMALGPAIRTYAHASMDISDGLFKDLDRLCRASGVGADVRFDLIPVSAAASVVFHADPTMRLRAISSGDDYEILATIDQAQTRAFEAAALMAQVPVTRIGTLTGGTGLSVRDATGAIVEVGNSGWDHF